MTALTYFQAHTALVAAQQEAQAQGVSVCIAVQDEGGHAMAFARMDGTFLGAIELAEKKARTSVLYRIETQELWEHVKADGPAHGIELTNGISVTFAGGVPLRDPDNAVIGAIGVSGGSVAQDGAIARAGAAALVARAS